MSSDEGETYEKEKRSLDDSDAVVEEDGEKQLKMESLSKSGGNARKESDTDDSDQ
ncbi:MULTISPECIES: hypothetical protein [Halobaculum]|uniref:Uncharacterized protein n=2 Tax=Halobaculum TaxID=43927 RepID=A0A8T8WAQ6_9EURY|nr:MULTISPECIES: hypothetical protein [Halobaculum]QZP36952.1 hypothetical protein K6T50_11710 [Halobaculum magnesiiphilum]QZY02002.1 hypothetical protein K6T36_11875 [Halobaculum roseum]